MSRPSIARVTAQVLDMEAGLVKLEGRGEKSMGRFIIMSSASVLCLLATGCAALKGYPETSSDPGAELTVLAKYFQPNYIQGCIDKQDNLERRRCRDEIVNGRIRAIDLHFNAFQKELFKGGVTGNIAVDWAVLALSATGAVAGTAATKAALAAASGGLVGAKGSFDKNAYFEKTMPVILSRMIAERKKVLATIREGMAGDSIEEYPLHRALIDVEDYYSAGTLPGAIMAVAEDAGKTAKKADEKIENLFKRTPEFVTLDRQKRVDQILDIISGLNDAAVLNLDNYPPVSDPEIERVIKLLDPQNRRFTDPKVARKMLKTRTTMSKRSKEDLDAWEAALRAAQ